MLFTMKIPVHNRLTALREALVADLKPCPICGRAPWYEATLMDKSDEVGVYIECRVGCALTKTYRETADAEKAWNAGEVMLREA